MKLGASMTPEQRAKMSAARRREWADPAVRDRRVAGRRKVRELQPVSVRFDLDTYGEILARAETNLTSFSDEVRLLVEWGLETARQAERDGRRS